MGIGSGAFVGPSPARQMAPGESTQFVPTHGVIDELQRGVPSGYLTVLFVAAVAVAAGLRRASLRRRDRDTG